MTAYSNCLLSAAGAVLALLLTSAEDPSDVRGNGAVRFGRDVRPILADKCLVCHGPDRATREARLRLDDEESAHRRGIFEQDEDGVSVFVERITAAVVEDRMPPSDSGLALSADELDVLRRWAATGARYEPHWSFVPLPADVPVPGKGAVDWARSDLDRFVLARLTDEGLTPTPEAQPLRWLRRATYDLTGLPPTPEAAAALSEDPSEAGYEQAVEQLLASPAFGERMATPWLDAARYADSYGYQSDQLSPTWPYRDWVVRAFNQNLPYDEFLTWQIAGDLLSEATPGLAPHVARDQRLATAFNRLHRMTNEGGSIEAEWRNEYVADRVHTLGSAVLGLSLECARCHDHKYDPLPQADYYSLYAYFNSIDEYGMYHDSSRVPTPSLLLPTADQAARLAELEQAVVDAQGALAEARISARARFAAWLASEDAAHGELPGLVGHYPLDELEGESELQLANLAAPDSPGHSTGENAIVEGRFGQALRFTGDDVAEFPKLCSGFPPDQPFTLSLWLNVPASLDEAVLLHRSSGTDVGFHGLELSLEESGLFFAFARFWPGNAIAVGGPDLPRDRWVHLAATYDGSFDATGMRLYVDGERGERILRNELTKLPGQGGDGLSAGQRFRDWGLRDSALDELRVFDRALAPLEVRELAVAGVLTAAVEAGDEEQLFPYYLAAFDAEFRQARAQLSVAKKTVFEHRTTFTEVPVMRELETPRPAHTLKRGDYAAPRTSENLAPRRTPKALPAPVEPPADRLGLARWLTAPDHSLTARVAVNRLWMIFFERGLVATPEDFGLQSEPPSHPELLDWLARHFVASGWDVKALCAEIVLSATYRQDSTLRPELQERDPVNALLARGPSGRLASEMIRDTALFAAGLLDRELGGPPVSPYQPPGLWRESNTMSPAYAQSVGTGLYRRSLYTVWKRTSPIPNMSVFDSPTREVGCSRRQRTNTPLQALVLLNDVQFVEAARVLAERMLREAPEAPIAALFSRLTGRLPRESEAAVLLELFTDQRAAFLADPDGVAALLGAGERPLSEPFIASAPDRAELAALTIVAQVTANLDATVWKR